MVLTADYSHDGRKREPLKIFAPKIFAPKIFARIENHNIVEDGREWRDHLPEQVRLSGAAPKRQ